MSLRRRLHHPSIEQEIADARRQELVDRRLSRLNTMGDYQPGSLGYVGPPPYDWEQEKDIPTDSVGYRNSQPATRAVKIDTVHQPAPESTQDPLITRQQRCIDAIKYTSVLAVTFVEVLKEAYLPQDPLEEARQLSEQEGVSTVIHLRWK